MLILLNWSWIRIHQIFWIRIQSIQIHVTGSMQIIPVTRNILFLHRRVSARGFPVPLQQQLLLELRWGQLLLLGAWLLAVIWLSDSGMYLFKGRIHWFKTILSSLIVHINDLEWFFWKSIVVSTWKFARSYAVGEGSTYKSLGVVTTYTSTPCLSQKFCT